MKLQMNRSFILPILTLFEQNILRKITNRFDEIENPVLKED